LCHLTTHTSRSILTYSDAKSNINKQNLYINWTLFRVTFKIQYDCRILLRACGYDLGVNLLGEKEIKNWPPNTTFLYHINIATCFDIAKLPLEHFKGMYRLHLMEKRCHFLHNIFTISAFLFSKKITRRVFL
jgi:hypothetical protein